MILVEKKWLVPERSDGGEKSAAERIFACRRDVAADYSSVAGLDGALSWHDPFSFLGMEVACKRILEAKERNEKVLIYGDYDADGVSATALLYLFFGEMQIDRAYYVPDRVKDGYGIAPHLVSRIQEKDVRLVVTVDCGVSNLEEVEWLQEHGVDVIVTDHHEVKEALPKAVAVLDAKRRDNTYPFRELCGAGVALKLVQALCESGAVADWNAWEKYVDIATLGTVADVVPLTDENRLLVKRGLEMIRVSPREGIRALLHASGKTDGVIGASTLAFTLSPRLNAAGRMGSAARSVELLVSKDLQVCARLAAELVEENKNRQDAEQRIFQEAEAKLVGLYSPVEEVAPTDSLCLLAENGPIVLWGSGWHPGVLGIVAARLVERYNRSAIILTEQGETGVYKGSARANAADNILETIEYASEYTETYGGHKKAAGLSVRKENLGCFSEKIRAFASRTEAEDLPSEIADMELYPDEVSLDTAKSLGVLEPFGECNREPCFFLRDCEIVSSAVRSEGKHLALRLRCSAGEEDWELDAIFFRNGHLEGIFPRGKRVDILFTLSVSVWRKKEELAILVQDMRMSRTGSILDDQPEVLEKLFGNQLPLKQVGALAKGNREGLCFSAEDIKKVYRFLSSGYKNELMLCDYRLLALLVNGSAENTNLSAFGMARILDIFAEAGLIRVFNKNDRCICFLLMSVTEKVILKDTPTFTRILAEGGIAE